MTERIPCKNEGCSATILPATFQKTGGYCMPCQQKKERQERQNYIMKHRRTADLFEGITDPVEVLKIMHTSRPYNPLIEYTPYAWSKEQLYVSLSAENADQLEAYAVELLHAGDEDTCLDVLGSLVCYNNKRLTDSIPELMRKGLYAQGIVFKDASAEVRDRLLRLVEQDHDNRNHLLLALSWIGDEQVVRHFREWRENRPEWAEELYAAPERYTYEAGWELTAEGERRNLFYQSNYAIEKADTGQDSVQIKGKSASFLTESRQVCPWCGGKLTNLIDIEADHPAIHFLPLAGERLQVQTCIFCNCYGPVYMELDAGQEPKWSDSNQKPDCLPAAEPDRGREEYLSAGKLLSAAAEPRNTCHAAQWTLEPKASQLGGYPTWIQDAEYPVCPCCSQSMHFIGQLDWEEMEEYGEGIYYMFLCPDGNVSATLFQQS